MTSKLVGKNCLAAGDCIPIAELDENVVKVYVQDVKLKTEEIFVPFKKFCSSRNVSLGLFFISREVDFY